MKIQIKDLYPNPYRDMDNYPISREKVEALKASIKQTGFWDNIVARNKDGKVQIAYGHHRLTALREALPWDTEVDIPIRDISDSTMIQIMANENMQEYATSPATIDETVKVAKKFLEDNPEELKKYQKYSLQNPTAIGIATFLNWVDRRVSASLDRLNLIESGTVSKAAINQLPTDNAARSFTKAAAKWELPIEDQERVVHQIKQSGNFGYEQIEKKIAEARFKQAPPVDKKKVEEKVNRDRFASFCIQVKNDARQLSYNIGQLMELKEQFNYLNFKDVDDAKHKAYLLGELKDLSNRIQSLLNTISNEYNSN
jgi:ParB-like chromosome segregation protein Spo0J